MYKTNVELTEKDFAAIAAAGFNLSSFVATPPTGAQLDAMADAVNRARARREIVQHLQNLGAHI